MKPAQNWQARRWRQTGSDETLESAVREESGGPALCDLLITSVLTDASCYNLVHVSLAETDGDPNQSRDRFAGRHQGVVQEHPGRLFKRFV